MAITLQTPDHQGTALHDFHIHSNGVHIELIVRYVEQTAGADSKQHQSGRRDIRNSG